MYLYSPITYQSIYKIIFDVNAAWRCKYIYDNYQSEKPQQFLEIKDGYITAMFPCPYTASTGCCRYHTICMSTSASTENKKDKQSGLAFIGVWTLYR